MMTRTPATEMDAKTFLDSPLVHGIRSAAIELELRSILKNMRSAFDPTITVEERCAAFLHVGKTFDELTQPRAEHVNDDELFQVLTTSLHNILAEIPSEYGNKRAA